MKDRIKKIIEDCGNKHFSQGMKRDKELVAYINNTYPEFGMTYAEIAWCILYDENPICKNGKKRAWQNIDKGFRPFCGRGKTCQCFVDSVSQLTKTGIMNTDRDAETINQKRENTNLEKYGVKNVSQVEEINAKREDTIMERFGVRSVLCLQEVKEEGMLKKYGHVNASTVEELQEKKKRTSIEKYGVDHFMKQLDVRKQFAEMARKCHPSRSHISTEARAILDNKETFIKFVSDKTFQEAIKELNISQVLYHKHCRLYELNDGYRSSLERSFGNFLKILDIEFIANSRSIIKPLELDFYLPQYNIAFELDGLRYHTELAGGKGRTYHYDKMMACRDKGIRLVSIFDDEWAYNNEKCKLRVKNILGKSEKGIGARKLSIKKMSWSGVRAFLNKNHLQGAGAPTTINLAAVFNDEIIAVMTFAKARYILGSHGKNFHELVRFVTDGKNNPGIASKLLKHFVTNYNPKEIISYSDNRWSEGDLYKSLSFTYIGESKPTYWYTENFSARIHKAHFRKSRIYKMLDNMLEDDLEEILDEEYNNVESDEDEDISEWGLMQEIGYDRVWDCGKKRWLWNC